MQTMVAHYYRYVVWALPPVGARSYRGFVFAKNQREALVVAQAQLGIDTEQGLLPEGCMLWLEEQWERGT